MPTKNASSGNGSDLVDRSVLSEGDGLPKIEVIWPPPEKIAVRLSGVRIARLALTEMREDIPLLALLSFPDDRVFVSFPLGGSGLQKWDGVSIESGALLLHAPGSRMRWRSLGWSRVGFVSFTLENFEEWSRTLLHRRISRTKTCFILAPQAEPLKRLLYLHADAIRLAEGEEALLSHFEIVRSLEDEIVVALMTCLSACDGDRNCQEQADCAGTLRAVEDAVQLNPRHDWSRDELGAAAGVSPRRLGACCNQLVQMAATRYVRLLRQFRTSESNGGSFGNGVRANGSHLH
jgi:hypothetical protein